MNPVRFTLIIIFIFFLLQGYLPAQIIRNGVTFYGNEWINYDQQYARIRVGEDGIYRLTYQQMAAAGLPVDQIDAGTYRLYWLGTEQRLYTSKATGSLTESDYLEFYGEKNRSQVDRYLFSDPDRQMLNPEYGLTTDTSTYFLTWTAGNPSQNRYDQVENKFTGQLPSRKTWYLHREQLIMSDQHFKGALNSAGVRLSTYGEGEGFASPAKNNHTFELTTSAVATEGPEPQLHFRMTGNLQPHQVSMRWNGQERLQFNFVGNNQQGGSVVVDSVIALSRADLKANNSLVATTTGNTRFAIAGISYPRTFRFEGQDEVLLEVDDTREGVYLELEDFGHSGQRPLVYDLSGGFTLEGTIEGNLTRINLPSGPRNRKILIVSAAKNKRQPPVTVTTFDDLRQSDANYILVSHRDLFDDGQGQNQVAEYARYRQTAQGGQYRTRIIDIQQLIDQFAYGVARHPLSIKNFVNYIHEHWQGPEFLFLVGKGLEYSQSRKSPETYDYLPVFGIPGSDNLLTSQGESSVPLVPVGRLAARNPGQIAIYLEKIKVMEDQIANAPQTIEDRGWMKRVLHLSGGDGIAEQNTIHNKLNLMSEVISGQKFGANITTVKFESSSEIIDQSIGESTLDLINSGIILKTYFGHGGITTTQFQGLEDPFFLENRNRYPAMLALGCLTGNLFVKTISLGESNVLTPNKGASVYLATSGLGAIGALDIVAKEWYNQLSNDLYGASLGKTVQATLSTNDNNAITIVKSLQHQFLFHGDPAFKIHPPALAPDLLIDYSSVEVSPESIDLQVDSFMLSFDVVNIGKIIPDSFSIQLRQKLPSGTILNLLTYRTRQLSTKKSIKLKLPIFKDDNSLGINTLFIEVDSKNEIPELPDQAENNNDLQSTSKKGYDFTIFDSALRPLLPTRNGITNNPNPRLIAASTNPLASSADYEIELDTTILFNSPLLIKNRLPDQTAILQWQPNTVLLDNTVYYWRVRSIGAYTNTSWMNSSFLYNSNISNGWNQSHYYQFLENDISQLPLSDNRLFSFSYQYNDFKLKNKADPSNATGANGFVNSQRWSDFFRWELTEGLTFIILDSSRTYGFWFNEQPGQFGSINKSAEKISAFPFSTKTAADRALIIKFIDQIIPHGTRVIAYTMQSDTSKKLSIEEWSNEIDGSKSLYTVFEEQGATEFKTLSDNVRPYIFDFIKGVRPVREIIADASYETIEYSVIVPILKEQGTMWSTNIGPGVNWTSVDWFVNEDNNDSSYLSIWGISNADSKKILLQSTDEFSLHLNHPEINNYQFLQFQLNTSDRITKTPSQLQYFRILYDGLPEVTFNQGTQSVFSEDTILSGNSSLISTIIIQNLSDYPMDSILVKYTFSDRSQSSSRYQRYSSLAPHELLTITETHSITADSDLDFRVELNPDNDQPELYLFNNFLTKKIRVNKDLLGPVLDVTFDGKRLINEDIVSPNPLIKIFLKDENRNLLLTDTAIFRIILTDPNGSTSSIKVNQDDVIFIPASTTDNQSIIEWSPNFQSDGIYELSVQGRDISGNRAGTIPYNIRFNVILKSTLSSVINYPNPFSSSTRFLYTLTGSVIPERYKISIFNSRGIIVRELTEFDLGPLKIGQNLTDKNWDGTDQFGDKLANGTYLYTFKIIDSQFTSEHLGTPIDHYSDKNYGKLVIIR
jgi:hypothetical protein